MSGSAKLKELRQARGWSWKDEARELQRLAKRLNVERVASATVESIARTVARWESGQYKYKPDERYQLLLAHAYAVRGGRAAVGPDSDFEHLLSALAGMGVPVERRQALRALATSAVTAGSGAFLAFFSAPAADGRFAVVLEAPDRLSLDDVHLLERSFAALQRQVEHVMPFARLHAALTPIVQMLRRLLTGRQPAVVRVELCSLAARCFTLAARVSFELHDERAAGALYGAALAAASELDDGARESATLTSASMVTLYGTGNVDRALALADRALRRGLQGSSTGVRARAFALKAELHTSKGDEREGLRALDSAGRLVVASGRRRASFDQARLDGFSGRCHLQLGRWGQAAAELERSALALSEPRDAVQRSIILADLSLAYIRAGDPPAGCHVLGQCVDIAGKTRGRVAAQRVRQVRAALDPWRTERFVRELDGRVLSALLP